MLDKFIQFHMNDYISSPSGKKIIEDMKEEHPAVANSLQTVANLHQHVMDKMNKTSDSNKK